MRAIVSKLNQMHSTSWIELQCDASDRSQEVDKLYEM